jgi:hypothetical protein
MPFARCNSHRSRQKLEDILERKPISFYSWHRACTGGYLKISVGEIDIARTIKGITIVRGDTTDFLPCWH